MSAGSRFVFPYQTAVDITGVPLPGALLYFYVSGTSTPLNTYSDQALTAPNANPVVANSAGEFPNIFLQIENYKVVLTDSSTNEIWTADPVLGGPPLGGQTATLPSAATVDLGSVTASVITISGTTEITSFGTTSLPGDIKALIFSGILTLTQSAGLLLPNAGSDITTAAGDRAVASCITSGNWEILIYQRADGTPLAVSGGGTVGASQLLASAQGFNAPLNLRIVSSVALNALTVALKDAGGNDPTAASPVLIPFRDPTATNGDPIISSLQAPLSFVVSGTNTMGAVSGVPFRLWGIAYYNGGAVALGLFNASTATQIFGLAEGNLVTTAAGTNGGSSAGVHYANVATITNTPFRILGYLEWASGLVTAGAWATVPTTIQLFGPGIKKPGDIVQETFTSTGTVATGTTVLPYDNTIPQNTEGDQYMSLAITPMSTANILTIDAQAHIANSGAGVSIAAALFQDSSANALAVSNSSVASGAAVAPQKISWTMIAGTSATTFKIRGGSGTAGTTTFNGVSGSQLYGGAFNSYMRIREIMG